MAESSNFCVLFAARDLLQGGYSYGGGTTGGGTTAVSGGTAAAGAGATTTGGGRTIAISPWELGQNFADQTASVGDTITFTWPSAVHGVYRIPTGECPSTFSAGQNGQESIQEPAEGPKTVSYTFQTAGTYWFACPVDQHCQGGLKVKVTVT